MFNFLIKPKYLIHSYCRLNKFFPWIGYILKKTLLLVILICLSISIPPTRAVQSSPKYFILKIDDFGFGNWTDTVNAFLYHKQYIGDFGVIGKYTFYSVHDQLLLKSLLATHRIDIFNHGWNHVIPEFQNHTAQYMEHHINFWNDFVKRTFNIKDIFVLGAPGNAIGLRNDCSEPVYQAMNYTGYKVLFFSSCCGTTKDGDASLDLPYLASENDLVPNQLSVIKNDLNKMSSDKVILTQVHFSSKYGIIPALLLF